MKPGFISAFIFLLLNIQSAISQVNINFTVPDTVCAGDLIRITNLTTGGSNFYWNFCTGDANANPIGVNIGNPGGLLSIPTYITLVRQNNDCFSFISCQGVGVVRYYHGNSFANNPQSWVNLGTFGGMIDFSEEGIQIKNDKGNWYGFVNSYTTMIRLNFGTSLWNTPTATNLNISPSFNMAHGLALVNDNGNWVALVACSLGNSLFRLNFGNSLANSPVVSNFGDIAGFTSPKAVCIVNENSSWYALLITGNTSLARISFGTTLLNAPTGTNLGNPGGLNTAVGLTLLRDCNSTTGYWTDYIDPGQLGKLTFPAGITGPVTGKVLGNIGNLSQSHSFSELFRQNDTLFAYITNRLGSMTRLMFPPCNNATVPSSTSYNPPPFSYNSPGIYNVRLIVDEGLPTETVLCKPVVVGNSAPVHLGPDRGICPGASTVLDAGAGFGSYLWSTGESTQSIVVGTAGKYWVAARSSSCTGTDTVNISIYSPIQPKLKPDTAICLGQKYILNPGQGFNSLLWSNGETTGTLTVYSGGQYWVHTLDKNNCAGADTVLITVKPEIKLQLVHDTAICSNVPVILHATVPGAQYLWQDGSRDSLFTVTDPGVYWVRVSRDSCAVQDTSFVQDCSVSLYFPNAFTPNGDGLNDYFRGVGPQFSEFKLSIYDRWGQEIFTTNNQETGWDGTFRGKPCPAGEYSFIATFRLFTDTGTSGTEHGNVTLLR